MRSVVHSVSIVAFALAAAAAVAGRPLPNSFVNRSVKNSQELVSQVKHDPEVADRYERHFAMNREETLSYLSSLHRDKLANAGYYTVYSVPKDGHLKMHVEKLKKGEPVFVDGSGQPILMVKCGNPLTLGPNKSARANPMVPTPTETSTTRELVDTPEEAPVVDNPETILTMTPGVPEEVAVVPPTVTTSEAAMVPVEPSVPAVAGGGGGFPWLIGLPLIVPFVVNHGGGGGGPTPVPEPATLVALGTGAAVLIRRRRK